MIVSFKKCRHIGQKKGSLGIEIQNKRVFKQVEQNMSLIPFIL